MGRVSNGPNKIKLIQEEKKKKHAVCPFNWDPALTEIETRS